MSLIRLKIEFVTKYFNFFEFFSKRYYSQFLLSFFSFSFFFIKKNREREKRKKQRKKRKRKKKF